MTDAVTGQRNPRCSSLLLRAIIGSAAKIERRIGALLLRGKREGERVRV